jgi:hypothetical protein
MPVSILALLLSLFPPCPTEDSSWCGWDAAVQGNGRGQSFIALGSTVLK